MAHSNLVENWKTVLILSISFWAQVAGLLVLIVPELIFAYTGIDTNPAVLWWAGMLLLLFGLVGRLFKQSNVAWVEWLRTSTVFFIIALLALVASSQSQASTKQEATLDIAVPLIAKWEGLRLQAYLDIVGVPTICYGSTRGVSLGTRKTERQCEQLLRVEVAEYRCGWLGYVLPEGSAEPTAQAGCRLHILGVQRWYSGNRQEHCNPSVERGRHTGWLLRSWLVEQGGW